MKTNNDNCSVTRNKTVLDIILLIEYFLELYKRDHTRDNIALILILIFFKINIRMHFFQSMFIVAQPNVN